MNSVIKLSAPATKEFWEIPVLFEDAEILVLDKPAGLLVSPDGDDATRPSLMKLLHTAIADGKPWTKERGLTYLNNVQETEAEMSGILLLAKSKTAFTALADSFGSNQPVKKFLALVHGSPREERFEVNSKIGPHPVITGMMRVDSREGKTAQTIFEVVERFPGHTLLRCQTLTERPHQIRVHVQNSGLRIAGDQLYGGRPLLLSRLKKNYSLKPGREERPLLSMAALHAEQLELPHPVTGATLSLTAPWPKDLKVAVKYLRLYAT